MKGRVVEKEGTTVVLEVGGIGYTLHVPSNIGHLQGEVVLYTAFIVREQSQTLYGFVEKEQRDLYERLITLSGIGPKTALGILGTLTLAEIAEAVFEEKSAVFSKVPGIGKKGAEKLILDLKGKIAPKFASTKGGSHLGDALAALMNLGYAEKDAMEALKSAQKEEPKDLSTLITLALKHAS